MFIVANKIVYKFELSILIKLKFGLEKLLTKSNQEQVAQYAV